MDQVVVLHRGSPTSWEWREEHPEWMVLGTCLRQIAIGSGGLKRPELKKGDQCFAGEEAYSFLLEIVCGLHSPVVGETEVFGQFKAFIERQESLKSPRAMMVWLRRIANDAKKIRHDHLRDLGCQSYGSLVRKEIKGAKSLHLIGFGHLAQEILPWLKKSKVPMTVHVRRPDQITADVEVMSLSETTSVRGVVVVAAPIKAVDFKIWLGDHSTEITKVIDLRGESQQDPLQIDGEVVDLNQVMGRLSGLRESHTALIARIKQEIKQYAVAANQSARVRPQGWDDLCA